MATCRIFCWAGAGAGAGWPKGGDRPDARHCRGDQPLPVQVSQDSAWLFYPLQTKDWYRGEGKGRRCCLGGQNLLNSLPRYYICFLQNRAKIGTFSTWLVQKVTLFFIHENNNKNVFTVAIKNIIFTYCSSADSQNPATYCWGIISCLNSLLDISICANVRIN